MEEVSESEIEMDQYNEVEIATGPLDTSVKFHVVKDILGFILYMHQQIPSVLQDLKFEFESLQAEYKELELYGKQNEVKSAIRRQNSSKMRQVKYGIKRLQKLMTTTAEMEAALQLLLIEVPNIQNVLLILGSNSIRPQHVYEMCFSHGRDHFIGTTASNFAKSKVAEGLSRKAIRMLISKGAGSSSYAGQSKLFLVVKAPSSLNLPRHFLPKRDFRHCKKVMPVRLRLKCKLGIQQISDLNHAFQPSRPIDFDEASFVWYQCRHVIKGMTFSPASVED